MTELSERGQGGAVTGPVGVRRLLRSRLGAAAVEFALVTLLFVTLLFGIIEFSRLIWMQSALQFAVEKAARCAVVNTSVCGTQAQVQAYAGSQMLASGVPITAFSYAANACGGNVSATVNFTFVLAIWTPRTLTLKAQSCYPT